MDGQASDIDPTETDASPAWALKAGEDVYERGFARSVWADQAEDLADTQREAYATNRGQSIERDDNVPRFELLGVRPTACTSHGMLLHQDARARSLRSGQLGQLNARRVAEDPQ